MPRVVVMKIDAFTAAKKSPSFGTSFGCAYVDIPNGATATPGSPDTRGPGSSGGSRCGRLGRGRSSFTAPMQRGGACSSTQGPVPNGDLTEMNAGERVQIGENAPGDGRTGVGCLVGWLRICCCSIRGCSASRCGRHWLGGGRWKCWQTYGESIIISQKEISLSYGIQGKIEAFGRADAKHDEATRRYERDRVLNPTNEPRPRPLAPCKSREGKGRGRRM